MRKWMNFAPPSIPAWSNLFHMVPNQYGAYAPGNIFITHEGSTLVGPTTTLRAFVCQIVSGTAKSFIGTTTQIYEYDGAASGTYTDRSIAGGYTNTATDWGFAQYGNITIACNKIDATQYRDSSGSSAFANLTGAPKAQIAVVQSNCVLLFNVNGGTDYLDGYHISDVGDYTNWTTGESVSGRLLQTPGPITAAVPFKDYVLVFKANSTYRMNYVGAPLYWTVDVLSDSIGTPANQALVCDDYVIILGSGLAYRFDGMNFIPISNLLSGMGGGKSAVYMRGSKTAYFHGSTGQIACYNLISDAWGRMEGHSQVDKVDGDYRLFEGSPSALSSLFGIGGVLANDTLFAVNLTAAGNPVQKSSKLYGEVAEVGGLTAYISTNAVINGRDEDWTVSRVHVDATAQFAASSNQLPSATELRLNVSGQASPAALSDSVSALVTNAVSSTARYRFDVNVTAKAFLFRLTFPDQSGYLEVVDIVPQTRGAGKT